MEIASDYQLPAALEALGYLMARGLMRRFCAIPPAKREGDCHNVAFRLAMDLRAAGLAEGWTVVQARINGAGRRILHSWLERDGWCADFSNTKHGPARTIPASRYYEQVAPSARKVFTVEELGTPAGRQEFWRRPQTGRLRETQQLPASLKSPAIMRIERRRRRGRP